MEWDVVGWNGIGVNLEYGSVFLGGYGYGYGYEWYVVMMGIRNE